MASEMEKKRPEFTLIRGGLNENSSSEKKPAPGRLGVWLAKACPCIVGMGVLLALGAVGLKYFAGNEKAVARFNMVMNIGQVLESTKDSGLRELALKNLEGMENAGKEELLLLRKAIKEVEGKRSDCRHLLKRMRALEKKWMMRIDGGKPVSNLRWRMPALKKAHDLKRIPQRVARSRC